MKRKLPPFTAVRAFEAAARHQSFKLAAEELHLTQSAISHQVKGLEEFLGVALFRRNGHGVELTPSGSHYVSDVSRALDRLSASTEHIAGVHAAGLLKLRTTPAFASRWLMPRMSALRAAHPEIDVEVTTTTDPMHFPDDDTDVLIQYGTAPDDGLHIVPFLSSTRIPVCSPAFLKTNPGIRTPGDLARVTVLRDVVSDEWEAWLARAGATTARLNGPRLAHCELTLRAAEEGQGVALGYIALIRRELTQGKLVKLFDIETEPKVIYAITCREARANHPRIAAFRNWVMIEAAKDDGEAAAA